LKKVFNNLTFWVLASITAGILVGYLSPSTGVAMQPLGTYFIEVVKLFISPIILLTIISGICGMSV
jgi:aerobic C4-dicarboxylate transport protein